MSAKQKMIDVIVKVGKRHINKANTDEPGNRAVALALKDAGFPQAGVSYGCEGLSIFVRNKSTRSSAQYITSSMPNTVLEFEDKFDDGAEVQPFKFKFSIPAALAKKAGYKAAA